MVLGTTAMAPIYIFNLDWNILLSSSFSRKASTLGTGCWSDRVHTIYTEHTQTPMYLGLLRSGILACWFVVTNLYIASHRFGYLASFARCMSGDVQVTDYDLLHWMKLPKFSEH